MTVNWELSMCVICSVVGMGLPRFKGQLVPSVVIGSFQMLRLFSGMGIVHSPQHRKKGLFLESGI